MQGLKAELCKLGYASNFLSKQSMGEVVADAKAMGSAFSIIDGEYAMMDYSQWEPDMSELSKEATKQMVSAVMTRPASKSQAMLMSYEEAYNKAILAANQAEQQGDYILAERLFKKANRMPERPYPYLDENGHKVQVDENHLGPEHSVCRWTTSGDDPVTTDEASQSDAIRHTLDGYDGETKTPEPEYEGRTCFNSMYRIPAQDNKEEQARAKDGLIVNRDGTTTKYMGRGKEARELRFEQMLRAIHQIDSDCDSAAQAKKLGTSNAKRLAKKARCQLAWLIMAWNSIVGGMNTLSYTRRRFACPVLQSGPDYWLSKSQFEALVEKRHQVLSKWSCISGLTIEQALSVSPAMKSAFGITDIQPRQISRAKMIEQVLASRKLKEAKPVQQLTLADFQPKSEEQAEWASEAYSY